MDTLRTDLASAPQHHRSFVDEVLGAFTSCNDLAYITLLNVESVVCLHCILYSSPIPQTMTTSILFEPYKL